MKRILFVAANVLPVNGPEAIVNAKLLKVLADEGYVIDVISKDGQSKYFSATIDDFFAEKLNSVNIINADNQINIRTIFGHIKVLFKTGYVYKGAHWAYYAIRCAEKFIIQYKYDYILSRNPPSELVGLFLSQKYNIPWIANWNDPYPEKRMPYPYGGGKGASLGYLEQKLLDNVSRKVQIHTFSSERQREYMLQYMKGIDREHTYVIPHVCVDGFFKKVEKQNHDKLRIIHSGNVSVPRDPVPFLEGVRRFVDRNSAASIEISFVGKQTLDFEQQVGRLDLSSWVKVVPPMPYLENLSYISGQDIALIIEAPSNNSVFLPTKVGDYMQCGKDIFAVSPGVGTLNDLYQKGVVKYFADCIDPEAITLELERIYAVYIKSNKNYRSDTKIIDDYLPQVVVELYKSILV